MIYCISDIHGDYDKYIAMLELIKLSDGDTLYVIGDIIDRGKRGVDIALDLMARKNAVFLLGNHEYMCIDALWRRDFDSRERWLRNGGGVTRDDLLYRRAPDVRDSVLDWFRAAPDCADLEVSGRKFHLVHGAPGETTYERIWRRPEKDAPPPMPGTTVIVGHTPTHYLAGSDGKPLRIWHGSGIIDIDCGLAGAYPQRRLGCLRLDDMAEFYT